jgi:hypothetical protein
LLLIMNPVCNLCNPRIVELIKVTQNSCKTCTPFISRRREQVSIIYTSVYLLLQRTKSCI